MAAIQVRQRFLQLRRLRPAAPCLAWVQRTARYSETTCRALFGEETVPVFAYFFTGPSVFLLLSFSTSLYVLGTSP